MDLSEQHGVLEKYDVEMIGANAEVIAKAEEPRSFSTVAMEKLAAWIVCKGEIVRKPSTVRARVIDDSWTALRRFDPSFTTWRHREAPSHTTAMSLISLVQSRS